MINPAKRLGKFQSSIMSSILKGFLTVGALKAVSILTNLLINSTLARGLSSQAFGGYSFVVSLSTLLAIPLGAAANQLIVRNGSACSNSEDAREFRVLRRTLTRWTAVCGVALLFTLPLAGHLGGLEGLAFPVEYLLVAVVLGLITALTTTLASVVQSTKRVALSQIPLLVVRPSLLLLASLGLISFGPRTIGAVFTAMIIAALVGFALAKFLSRKFDPSQWVNEETGVYRTSRWLTMFAPFVLISAITTLNSEIGTFILAFAGTAEDVAAYKVAFTGAQLSNMPLLVLNIALAPRIAEWFQKGNNDEIRSGLLYTSVFGFALCLPLSVCLFLFGKPLLGLAFGQEYIVRSYTPLIILLIGNLINAMCGSVALFLLMAGKEQKVVSGQILGLIVSVSGSAILMPLYGVVGVAIAMSCAMAVWNIALLFLLREEIRTIS